MSDSNGEPPVGDFVCVATCDTPTEAHLLKGVLQSAGLSAHVADAHIVQANSWMTQAVGGVRVLVPASHAEDARKTIVEFHAGTYRLEGEEPPVADFPPLPSPVFSPDRALLLSLLLTPAFGAALQFANARALGKRRGPIPWVAFGLLCGWSVLAIAVMHRISPGPFVAFRASLASSFITIAWYFLAGQAQARMLLTTYGPRYRRKSPAVPAIVVAAALLGLGGLLSEFA